MIYLTLAENRSTRHCNTEGDSNRCSHNIRLWNGQGDACSVAIGPGINLRDVGKDPLRTHQQRIRRVGALVGLGQPVGQRAIFHAEIFAR